MELYDSMDSNQRVNDCKEINYDVKYTPKQISLIYYAKNKTRAIKVQEYPVSFIVSDRLAN